MRPKLLALAASLVFAVAAGAQAQTGGVEIKDAWARATPGGAQTAAVYATIVAPAGDRLTAVSTPAAQQAGLHTMTMDNGVMKMRQVDGIDLPAGPGRDPEARRLPHHADRARPAVEGGRERRADPRRSRKPAPAR